MALELGQKLRQARLDAGMSQRQLCGDVITRNMLSQIEHGTARPSMNTLVYLAEQLGKPVGYFLEETPLASPNQGFMEDAWACYEKRDFGHCSRALKSCRMPDPVYERQWQLLTFLNTIALAESAIRQGRLVYARQLLAKAKESEEALTWLPELKQRRIRLLGQLMEPIPESDLPDVDEGLLLHARFALSQKQYADTIRLLEAMELHAAPEWNLLRGKAAHGLKQYAAAIPCLKAAETAFPLDTVPLLEECYRELGDFKNAYFYACKRR